MPMIVHSECRSNILGLRPAHLRKTWVLSHCGPITIDRSDEFEDEVLWNDRAHVNRWRGARQHYFHYPTICKLLLVVEHFHLTRLISQ